MSYLNLCFLTLCSWFILLESFSLQLACSNFSQWEESLQLYLYFISYFTYTMRRFTSNSHVTPSRTSMIISRKLDDVASFFRRDTIPWRSVDRHCACASMCTRSVIGPFYFRRLYHRCYLTLFALAMEEGGRYRMLHGIRATLGPNYTGNALLLLPRLSSCCLFLRPRPFLFLFSFLSFLSRRMLFRWFRVLERTPYGSGTG